MISECKCRYLFAKYKMPYGGFWAIGSIWVFIIFYLMLIVHKRAEILSDSRPCSYQISVIYLFSNTPSLVGQTLVVVVTPFCIVLSSLEQFVCFGRVLFHYR